MTWSLSPLTCPLFKFHGDSGKIAYQSCFPYPPVGCWIKSKNRKLRVARNCCYIFGIYMIHDTVTVASLFQKSCYCFLYLPVVLAERQWNTSFSNNSINTSSHPLPILFPSHPFLFPCHRRRWAWACPNAAPGGARTSEKDPGRRDSGFLPPNGLLMENTPKIDDLGYPYFLETSIYIYNMCSKYCKCVIMKYKWAPPKCVGFDCMYITDIYLLINIYIYIPYVPTQ